VALAVAAGAAGPGAGHRHLGDGDTATRPRANPFDYGGPPTNFRYSQQIGIALAVVGGLLFLLEIVWLIRSRR
jgi:hypothetical protein